MILMSIVEQHHVVPFHHRFLNTWFKEEENIQQMKERLIARVESSNHWLNELVQELANSLDTDVLDNLHPTPDDDSLTPEYNFGMISEALSELESNHPELFENLPLSEEVTEPNFISIDNELTDDELLESMRKYEEEMNSAFDSYDNHYLLEDEVSVFPLNLHRYLLCHNVSSQFFDTILNLPLVSHLEFIAL